MSEGMPTPHEVTPPPSSGTEGNSHTISRRSFVKGLAGATAGAVLATVIPDSAGAVPGKSQTAVKEEGGKCLVYVQEPFVKRLGEALRERSIKPLVQKFLIERDC